MPARPRPRPRPGRSIVAGAAVVAVLGMGTTVGCGRSEFEDRTAQLTVDDVTSTLDLDSCGLDGSTIFVVGRGPGDVVLQAVVGLADDDQTGVAASTGVTVDGGGWVQETPSSAALAESLGASGAESWERRGQSGRAPGSIMSAVLRGARIQVEGRLEPLDASTGLPVAASADEARSVPFRLDARCDETAPG